MNDQDAYDVLIHTSGGRWLLFVLGVFTISVMIFTKIGELIPLIGRIRASIKRWQAEVKDADAKARRFDQEQLESRVCVLEQRQVQFAKDRADAEAYEIWVAGVFYGLKLWAQSKGYEIPPPPLMSKSEWLEWREHQT